MSSAVAATPDVASGSVRWIDELRKALPNTVIHTPRDPLYHLSSNLFNAAINSPAQCAVLAANTQQVVTVVKFARRHGLSFSCKGGGFNVAGWAVQGDIILDLCLLDSIEVHTVDSTTGQFNIEPLAQLRTPAPESESSLLSQDDQLARKRKATGAPEPPPNDVQGASSTSGAETTASSIKRYSTNVRTASPTPLRQALGPSDPFDAHSEHGQASTSTAHSSPSSSRDGPHGVNSGSGSGCSGSGSGSGEASEETGSTSHPSREASHSDGKGTSPVNSRTDASAVRSSVVEGTRSWVEEQKTRGDGQSSLHAIALPHQSSQILTPNSPVTNAGVPLEQAAAYDTPTTTPAFATSFVNTFVPTIAGGNGVGPTDLTGLVPSCNMSIDSARIVFDSSALHRGSLNASSSNSAPIPSSFGVNFSSTARAASSSSESARTVASNSSRLNSWTSSRSHALVTIGAGAKSKNIDAVTGALSYHVPLAAYPVGCAVFASGGFGFMSRKHGLSMDNVVEVEMVLADGRVMYLTPPKRESAKGKEVELSEEELRHEEEMKDLWWAFRGAGLALGVITKIRTKAFPVGLVYSGNLIFPFNHITAPSLMKHWRDCIKNAPCELYTNLVLIAGPNESSHVIVIQLCYLGDREKGDHYLQALLSWEGERCLLKDVEMRTYLTQQQSVVQVLSAQRGYRWCIRADLMNLMTDDCIHSTVDQFKNIPERSAWLFELAGGAIADAPEESSCFPRSHRKAPFQVAAIHQWKEKADDALWKLAARRWIDSTISPYSPGGSYPCFLEPQESMQRTRSTFGGGERWERLKRVKRRYDPDKMLKHCFWIDEDDAPPELVCGA